MLKEVRPDAPTDNQSPEKRRKIIQQGLLADIRAWGVESEFNDTAIQTAVDIKLTKEVNAHKRQRNKDRYRRRMEKKKAS